MRQTTDHDLLTLDEAAQLLRCAKSTIRRYVDSGRLPAYKLGGGATSKLLFKREELFGLLEPAGESTASPIDPADLEEAERADTIAGVRRGIKAMRQGRVRSWKEIAAETRTRYGIPD